MLEQQGWQALPSVSYKPPVQKYPKYHAESVSEGQWGCEEKHQIGLDRYIGKVSQSQKKRKLLNTFDGNRDSMQEKTAKGIQRWLAQPLSDEDKWEERIAWFPCSSFKKISVIRYFFSKQYTRTGVTTQMETWNVVFYQVHWQNCISAWLKNMTACTE